jgi:putative ABC transport system ATP-binding protein
MQTETDKTAVMASCLSKNYQIGDLKIEVLKEIDLKIENGEFTAIVGPSGSGKTTLLNLISGIDRPTSGKIRVLDEELNDKDEDFLAEFRCKNIGFVFQSYNLVSTLTVAENVAFPMEWTRKPEDHIKKHVRDLLETVGLQNRADHFSFQLSGGEQQRVAFARALANDPPLLLVDEPTGNLDTETSMKIVDILQKLKSEGKTIIVVTHDTQIFKTADRKLQMKNGKLVEADE